LAGQGLVRADGNSDVLCDLHGLTEPWARCHCGSGRYNAFCVSALDAFVDRMTHPEVVTSNDEADGSWPTHHNLLRADLRLRARHGLFSQGHGKANHARLS